MVKRNYFAIISEKIITFAKYVYNHLSGNFRIRMPLLMIVNYR